MPQLQPQAPSPPPSETPLKAALNEAAKATVVMEPAKTGRPKGSLDKTKRASRTQVLDGKTGLPVAGAQAPAASALPPPEPLDPKALMPGFKAMFEGAFDVIAEKRACEALKLDDSESNLCAEQTATIVVAWCPTMQSRGAITVAALFAMGGLFFYKAKIDRDFQKEKREREKKLPKTAAEVAAKIPGVGGAVSHPAH